MDNCTQRRTYARSIWHTRLRLSLHLLGRIDIWRIGKLITSNCHGQGIELRHIPLKNEKEEKKILTLCRRYFPESLYTGHISGNRRVQFNQTYLCLLISSWYISHGATTQTKKSCWCQSFYHNLLRMNAYIVWVGKVSVPNVGVSTCSVDQIKRGLAFAPSHSCD